jgi:hypothetical protein
MGPRASLRVERNHPAWTTRDDRLHLGAGVSCGDRLGDAAIAPVRCAWRRAGRSGLPERCAWAPARARLPLSASSSVEGAAEWRQDCPCFVDAAVRGSARGVARRAQEQVRGRGRRALSLRRRDAEATRGLSSCQRSSAGGGERNSRAALGEQSVTRGLLRLTTKATPQRIGLHPLLPVRRLHVLEA